MDTYTQQLILSLLFFAPGIILLTSLIFVGILMAMESAGQFTSNKIDQVAEKLNDSIYSKE